ncbi:hypothetical protein D3C75_884070 [compost metagenome]
MMCDDEERPQRTYLKEFLNTLNLDIDGREQVLSELMYTASETGIIDNMSSVDAIIIWKIVELAKSFGDTIPDELRM